MLCSADNTKVEMDRFLEHNDPRVGFLSGQIKRSAVSQAVGAQALYVLEIQMRIDHERWLAYEHWCAAMRRIQANDKSQGLSIFD